MGDFASEVLKKYGLSAVIFAILFAAIIWMLSHWAAAPGKEVSILFGLTTYTKQIGKASEIDSRSATEPLELGEKRVSGKSTDLDSISSTEPFELDEKEVSRGTYEDAPPLTLILHPNVSQGNVDSFLQSERKKHQLRELTAAESGKSVTETPAGTYFYTVGRWIETHRVFDTRHTNLHDFQARFNGLRVMRFKKNWKYVEIHHPYDKEPNIILYLDEVSASRISQLSGVKQHELMAAIMPWRDMSTMIALPISRILEAAERDVQLSSDTSHTVLDLLVR